MLSERFLNACEFSHKHFVLLVGFFERIICLLSVESEKFALKFFFCTRFSQVFVVNLENFSEFRFLFHFTNVTYNAHCNVFKVVLAGIFLSLGLDLLITHLIYLLFSQVSWYVVKQVASITFKELVLCDLESSWEAFFVREFAHNLCNSIQMNTLHSAGSLRDYGHFRDIS